MPDALASLALLAGVRQTLPDALRRPMAAGSAREVSTAAQLTAACDTYFQAQFEARPNISSGPACCIAAVGGYGRAECSLHADIDVLLVYADEIPQNADALAGHLFRPLWDLKLDVGHGVRSVADCVACARQDMAVLASLLDLRLITGDVAVFEALQQAVNALATPAVLPGFLVWLDRETASRLARHGEAFALLEPHLKSGIGGLREIHTARWLHRLLGEQSALAERDVQRLQEDVGLLLEVRSRLHALCGSRQDLIPLDLLPDLAECCGYPGEQGPAHLLARLHRAMERCRAAAWWQRRAAAGAVGEPDVLQEEFPWDCWEALYACAATGRPPSLAARRRMEAEAQRDKEPPALFARLSQLLAGPHAAVAVEAMFETGLLAALVPAFGVSQDRIPYGGWHIRPVGRHSVETLRMLDGLADPQSQAPRRLRVLWEEERRRPALLWAALLHDIGKTPAEGSQGHCERGGHLASSVLAAWGAPADLVDEVAFLIREHLLLAETAHAEDPEDAAVVGRIIGRGVTPARLSRLLLLTYADSHATGPRVWNDWSASLLFALADAVAEALQTRDFTPAREVRLLLKRRDVLRSLAHEVYSPDAMEERLGLLTPRYLLTVAPGEVLRHLQLRDEFLERFEEALVRLPGGGQEGRVAVLQARPADREGAGAWEVAVAGRLEARLLAMASGVLALHGQDIMQADVFTWNDGFALHRFFVSPPPDPLYPDEFWSRVQSTLTYALSGKVRLEERLAEKRTSLLARNGRVRLAPEVDILADGDAFRVQVEADDRIGLLHDIVVGLEQADARVRTARIQTRGARAHDQFHISPTAAQASQSEAFVKRLREALLSRVSCG
ncbi:[protein-PII] uridylyltransferase family protein [Megalodesulfovibrio gigas]|uniref:Bifunctional uridylyltransferase/uridylyl-removing enzyme n=1 Tax=Megalodesulfovibrio gigas (strain ATCC 19364 / DSM 1382 / NCIMB 9332 / VKM B-1759) TaxID=1121448 RepID=T2GCH8_MEGG1|nr:HD domain-containing protein [Megalodesulfovibrio gigas]AGW14285.1 putative metal dependent phosphohydrolase [Megalodesulfovibrio gigas DSM 1382 = ATCC 19364]